MEEFFALLHGEVDKMEYKRSQGQESVGYTQRRREGGKDREKEVRVEIKKGRRKGYGKEARVEMRVRKRRKDREKEVRVEIRKGRRKGQGKGSQGRNKERKDERIGKRKLGQK